MNFNLTANPKNNLIEQWVIHLDEDDAPWTKAFIKYPVAKELYFKFSTQDNSYYLLKKLRKLIPDEPGALVLNYELEMSMLDHYKVSQTTYQLIHDDYNIKLAKKYGHLSDVFICHNSVIYEKLLNLFPDRHEHIFYLPHGVPVPKKFREPTSEKKALQLLFLGRMAVSKGVFDLPLINDLLREKGVKFEWTCIGGGPELEKLKSLWNPADKVIFLTPDSNEQVMEICVGKDVFVLPTKFEGSPVSLLETMSAGLVPVITDLPGGITDIVNDDIGFKIPMGDNNAFASAIWELYNDRNLLNRLSSNCRDKITKYFDVTITAAKYHELFSKYAHFYREKKLMKKKIGARLDHPLISQRVTKLVRLVHKKLNPKK